MIVQQFFVKKIAHSSYLLGADKQCAIIDPRRDVDIYIKAAEEWGMKITHILETHLHADFVSGHMDLAEKTGARIYMPKSANAKFDHIALSEGDTFSFESLKFDIIETPGHTPEHISYIVTDRERGEEPISLFCGDTLFVGDVGRPDLFPGRADELAEKLHTSLFEKILKLPDHVEVYPAHGAGSLCGKAMGAKRTSTLGYEKKFNNILQHRELHKFKEILLAGMPEVPDHFARCSAINGQGPAEVGSLPPVEDIKPSKFLELSQKDAFVVLDVRNYDGFSGHHVPNSYHVSYYGNFPIFSGWIIPPDKKILLVTEDKEQALDAVIWLRRVGLDNVHGFLQGGIVEWAKQGLPTGSVELISAVELHDMIEEGKEKITLVDTRSPGEFEGHHIEGAVSIPTPELRTRYSELKKSDRLILLCNSGNRSSLGISILMQHGFKGLTNLAGGMTGFSAAGYAPKCPICSAPHLPINKD